MNGYAATLFPPLRRVRLPLARDTALLLFVALNEALMGMESYLAHNMNGTLRFNEWIPVISGPAISGALLLALLIRRWQRPAGEGLALLALLASIAVGALGTYFHFVRDILPSGPAGAQVSIRLLVWGPPLIAPPAFILVGGLGLLALWPEVPDGSGALRLFDRRRLALPLSKSQLYFFVTSLGVLIAGSSSVLDHARTGFVNPWLWVPTLSGVFGTAVAFMLGWLEPPTRSDLLGYTATMALLLVVGPVGLVLHILRDLSVNNLIVVERFLRGAPVLAPMLFANMGLLGLLVLLDPAPGRT